MDYARISIEQPLREIDTTSFWVYGYVGAGGSLSNISAAGCTIGAVTTFVDTSFGNVVRFSFQLTDIPSGEVVVELTASQSGYTDNTITWTFNRPISLRNANSNVVNIYDKNGNEITVYLKNGNPI